MMLRRSTITGAALGVLLSIPASLGMAAGLSSVAAAQEPEIQLNDVVVYKSGEKAEGKILEEKSEQVLFRRKDATSAFWIPRSVIERIDYAESPEHHYRGRAGKLAEGDVAGHLALARFCLSFALERQAEAEAEKALKADPANIEGYSILSLVYRARYGKVDAKVHPDVRDRELAIYERAEKAGVLTPDLRLVKSRLLRECGAREAGLDELLKVEATLSAEGAPAGSSSVAPAVRTPTAGTVAPVTSADGPAFARLVRLELGNLALEVGRADVAARAFAALSGASPDDAGATVGAGLAAFARGELEAAAKHFERASELDPSRCEPHVLRAAVAVHEGDLRLAGDELQRAQAILQGAPMPGDGSLYGAFAAALAGKVLTARARLSHVDPAPPFGAEAALVEGLAAEVAHDPAAALAAYDRAAEVDPTFAGVARVARAQVLHGKGDRAGAEEALKEAARAGYDIAAVASLLSRSRRDAGDFATAVRYARYAADARPKDADILYALGRSYLGASKPDDAEAAFDAALAVEPTHAHALAGKARVLYGRGDFAAAEAHLRKAAKENRDLAFVGIAIQRIEEARTRRLWRDEYDRPDGKDVRNRWAEDERFGIEAGLSGGKLTLVGTQTNEDMGRTSVVRDVEGARFAEFRVAIDPSGAGKARAGIRLSTREGEIAFFRTPEGRLAYAVRAQANWAEPKDLGPWPAGPGTHELWIAIGGLNRENVILGIDENELTSPPLKISAFGRVNAFSCAVYVQAPTGARVDVSCERALLFIAREEKKRAGGGF